jgi:ABC-2 type transport system ATP-binding protein
MGGFEVVNGLGAPVISLLLSDPAGRLYEASRIAAGQKRLLAAGPSPGRTGRAAPLVSQAGFAGHSEILRPTPPAISCRAPISPNWTEIRSSRPGSATARPAPGPASLSMGSGFPRHAMKSPVHNLRKEFGRTVAVDNISFAFDSGHVFGFVGPNGAGKTTTMRIIATIEEPTAGDVFLNGVSLREEPEIARQSGRLRSRSAARPRRHDGARVPGLLRARLRVRGRHRSRAVAAVEEFTHVTGILDKHLKALSKGMKQRVSLGRALVHDPQILILDEPAAGLDPRARVELRELLALLAEQKKAILISSHILTELTEICNGVVIIERGQILETGTIAEVLKKSAPRRTVAIRLLEQDHHRNPQLLKELLQMPEVEQAREVANEIHFESSGDESAACEVLARLIARDFKILEFRQTKADLEDIFMTVTKGGVQ